MTGRYAIRWRGKELTPRFELATWLWATLVLSFFVLLGVPRLYTATVVLIMLVGIARVSTLLRRRESLGLADTRFAWIFFLYWAGLLFSLTDPLVPREAFRDSMKQLPYFFLGIGAAWLAQKKDVLGPLKVLFVGLALFLTLDTIFQRIVGFDIFGVSYNGFMAGSYFAVPGKFAAYLAALNCAAFYVLAPRLSSSLRVAGLWGLFGLAIFLTMTRTAWLMFLVVSLWPLWRHGFLPLRYRWVIALSALAATLVAGYVFYGVDPALRWRVDQMLGVVESMSYESWNNMMTYRLDLWRAALDIIHQHWINGVGLNGFISAFPAYPAATFWNGIQPSHEHQYILQVLGATGLIGLAGIVMIHVLLMRWWLESPKEREQVSYLCVYLLALWFPVNSHFSFYSSEYVWGNLLAVGLIVGGLSRNVMAPMSIPLSGGKE